MKRSLLVPAVVAIVTWLAARAAHAYPQLVLSHDQTCSGCHLSPAGGNLLSENGLNTAESISQFGTAPEFLNGKVKPPSWLVLGGDLRGAAGYLQTPIKVFAAFPMQLDLEGAATHGAFSFHATVGYRSPEKGNEAATHVWSREHYVMWEQNPGEGQGVFVRVGRFMPVYGLRLAEHDAYTRRWGGTQLYGETYGVHAAMIGARYEGHLTAFIRDPLIDSVEHSNGVMGYAEVRLDEHTAVGAEGMYKRSLDDTRFGGGVIGKRYFPGAKLLLQGEVQYVNQLIDKSAYNAAGGAPLQLIGYLLGTVTLKEFLLLDIGLGHYDSNFRIKNEDRDNIDVNLHWFATSHVELVWTNRIEALALGNGGPTGAWSLLMLHYRL